MNRAESKYFHTAARMDEALLSLLLEKEFEYITVKEICARAGVNRSTFYLHYETIADLLTEAAAMVNQRFQSSFQGQEVDIAAMPRENLFFITDEWLIPYLKFIQENRRFYRAVHLQVNVFEVERTYRCFFETVFSPILSRYGVAEEKHGYIMEFYRHGMVAILMKWVEGDCGESPETIAEIIKMLF